MMSDKLSELLREIESKNNSLIIEDTAVTLEQLAKLEHLLEQDTDLYQYLISKSSEESTFRKLMMLSQNEVISIIARNNEIYQKRSKDKDQQLLDLTKQVQDLKEQIKAIKLLKWVFIIGGFLGTLIVFWGLYLINPEAGRAVLELIRALGSVTNVMS